MDWIALGLPLLFLALALVGLVGPSWPLDTWQELRVVHLLRILHPGPRRRPTRSSHLHRPGGCRRRRPAGRPHPRPGVHISDEVFGVLIQVSLFQSSRSLPACSFLPTRSSLGLPEPE